MPAAAVPEPPWATGTWADTVWEQGTWGVSEVVAPTAIHVFAVPSDTRTFAVPADVRTFMVEGAD